jgi:hypothetical protein
MLIFTLHEAAPHESIGVASKKYLLCGKAEPYRTVRGKAAVADWVLTTSTWLLPYVT